MFDIVRILNEKVKWIRFEIERNVETGNKMLRHFMNELLYYDVMFCTHRFYK